MEVPEPFFDLIEEEIAGQRQSSRENDQFWIQHAAEVHAAHAQGFRRDIHAGGGRRIAGLRGVHDRLGGELVEGSQGGFLVGVFLQIVLRHQNQSVRGRVLLEAALLAAAARCAIDLVNLRMSRQSGRYGMAWLARPAASSMDHTAIHHDASADSGAQS